jgi:hypothetical protein
VARTISFCRLRFSNSGLKADAGGLAVDGQAWGTMLNLARPAAPGSLLVAISSMLRLFLWESFHRTS